MSTIDKPAERSEMERDVGSVDDARVESEEQQQTPALDKGKDVDMSSTRDVDDGLLDTKSSKDETKGPAAGVAAGVATLAGKFGEQITKSKKKGKKKKVDKRTERGEDLFDDSLLSESPNKKTLIEEENTVDEDNTRGGGERVEEKAVDEGEIRGGGERVDKKVDGEDEIQDGGKRVDEKIVVEDEIQGGGGRRDGPKERSLGVAEPMLGVVDESLGVAGDKQVEVEREMEDVMDVVSPVVVEEPALDVVKRENLKMEPVDLEGKTTREPIEEMQREARRTPEVRDAPGLESGKEVDTKMEDKPTSPVASERDLPVADAMEHTRSTQGTRGLARLERTWEEPGESPVLGRGDIQESRARAEETTPVRPVTPTRDLAPTLDESPYHPLRRSMSRNLEPVPEEEPEAFGSPSQARERRSRKPTASKSDISRDSGLAINPPRLGQRSQWQQEGPHRDSGVHLKDWAESSRHISPEPSRSRPEDPFKTPDTSERRLKKSPRSAKDLREHEHPMSKTPVFREPSPHAPTPEPQKPLRDYKTPDTPRSRYPELGTPSLPAKKSSVGRLAHAAPLSRSGTDLPLPRPGTISPLSRPGAISPLQRLGADSPAPGQRSVSDNTSRPRLTPSPDVAPRRVASNTSLTRHRTPDPKLRPDTPGSIRSLHSATPPLRRAGRRISGDLRSISLSQRGGQADAPPSADSGDELPSAHNSNSTPVANEGRVRSKDMTDVYVSSDVFCAIVSLPISVLTFAGWLWRGPHGLAPVAHAPAQHAPPAEHAGDRARIPGQRSAHPKSTTATRATALWRPVQRQEVAVAARRSRRRDRPPQALHRSAQS
ncbi:hypothetical protein IMZ48_27790 [Candidatus Bathyarchaeota archaeon]|nr:hypothetical protein [Candidatus Bathyarchaeota archaeon]